MDEIHNNCWISMFVMVTVSNDDSDNVNDDGNDGSDSEDAIDDNDDVKIDMYQQ